MGSSTWIFFETQKPWGTHCQFGNYLEQSTLISGTGFEKCKKMQKMKRSHNFAVHLRLNNMLFSKPTLKGPFLGRVISSFCLFGCDNLRRRHHRTANQNHDIDYKIAQTNLNKTRLHHFACCPPGAPKRSLRLTLQVLAHLSYEARRPTQKLQNHTSVSTKINTITSICLPKI